jgi:hypothetical protein
VSEKDSNESEKAHYFLREGSQGEEEEIFFTKRQVIWSCANIIRKKFQVQSDIIKVVWTRFSNDAPTKPHLSDLCILHQGNTFELDPVSTCSKFH